MTHYHKLAFTTTRIISTLVIIYSVLSFGYILITYTRGHLITSLLPAVFYLLLGVILFVFSKQIAKLAIKGIDQD
jgi:uncharacterized membrane protein (DUF485 family)